MLILLQDLLAGPELEDTSGKGLKWFSRMWKINLNIQSINEQCVILTLYTGTLLGGDINSFIII